VFNTFSIKSTTVINDDTIKHTWASGLHIESASKYLNELRNEPNFKHFYFELVTDHFGAFSFR
jgi:hypothetical protein